MIKNQNGCCVLKSIAFATLLLFGMSPFAARGQASGGHTNIAFYSFDDGSLYATDFSGEGNNGEGYGWFNTPVYITNDAAAGPDALGCPGDSWITLPTNLISALDASFTVSAWVKTTNASGSNTETADQGLGIVAANSDLVIPLAQTGSNIAFLTGGNPADTLNSTAPINSGNYTHVVVTRDQQTGIKKIYINGALNVSDTGTAGQLSSASRLGLELASSFTGGSFLGELDQVQIYAGVLSAGEVSYLYANPGLAVTNVAASGPTPLTLGNAVNAPQLPWTSYGNALWFGETTNTFDGVAAARSGSINENQVSVLQTFITGPGTLTFEWKTSPNGNNFDCQFAIDGNDTADIVTPTGWTAESFLIGKGRHMLTWSAQASGDLDPTEAAYLGDVNFAFDYGTSNQVGSHTLVAHYTFDNTNAIGADSSGNGYDLTYNGNPSGDGVTGTNDAEVGTAAAYFDGGSFLSYNSTPPPVMAALAGNFTLSVWVNTQQSYGSDGDPAYYDAQIVAADVPGVANDIIPMALTGGGIGFNTGGTSDDTLSSTGPDINDGNYHQIVVERNQALGEKWIFIDGVFNNTDFASTNLLSDPVLVAIGCGINASDPNPVTAGPTAFYNGLLDDLQVYSGLLSSNEISQLFDNPGMVITNGVSNSNTAPVITVNPFSQTNSPGYAVWLSASATGKPAPAWQWYNASGAISGATNSYYVPPGVGTAAVAGYYYAVATNSAGSATTLTAVVTFVSAPLPPTWSIVVNSSFHPAQISNPIEDYAGGCAVDSNADVYLADQVIGNADFALTNGTTENVINSSGAYGVAALIKRSANGSAIWAVGLSNNQTSSYSYAYSVAIAPGNGAYLDSILVGTNWLGTNEYANNGTDSILLSRFDANGSNVWSAFIGQSNAATFSGYNSLVADIAGNVTLAGLMSGSITFGSTVLSAGSGQLGFLVQYNSSGTVLWAEANPGWPQCLAYSSGHLYVAVSATTTGGVTNISIGGISNLTDRAYGVAMLNPATGQAVWLRGVGEQYGANTNGTATDDPLISAVGSNVFLMGNAYGSTAIFGSYTLPLTGGCQQYFARYDTNGNAQVATTFGSATTMAWATAADSSGVYVSGDFDDSSSFGDALIAAPEYYPSYLGPQYFTQPFLAKFDDNGNALWARNGISSLLGNFRGVATTSDGVWASGFVSITNGLPAQFGTNITSGDSYLVDGSLIYDKGGVLAKITESSLGLPVTLLDPQSVSGNLQFQFLSQPGVNYNVIYETNLTATNWTTYAVVTGDGTLKTVPIPLSVFSLAKEGFVRVMTDP
jgi:hypothetical protein